MARRDEGTRAVTFIMDGTVAEAAEAIAARETTIADGLRAIERAYRQALEPASAPEFGQILRPGNQTIEYDLELE